MLNEVYMYKRAVFGCSMWRVLNGLLVSRDRIVGKCCRLVSSFAISPRSVYFA